ncbi:MAG: thioredoxin family protein [Saprospiraceae bacterium]|nr:thioredoxin family protein [Saprospiraceae bacterium]
MIRFSILFCLTAILACQTPAKSPTATRTPPVRAARPQPAPVTNVLWLDSERLMPVLEQAQRDGKVVFVEFYASWCAPCKVMEEDVFTQVETFRYLNSNFLNFRTDFDSASGSTIAAIYEVKSLPTVLFLDPQGVVLERHTGVANPSLLRTMGDAAMGKMKR